MSNTNVIRDAWDDEDVEIVKPTVLPPKPTTQDKPSVVTNKVTTTVITTVNKKEKLDDSLDKLSSFVCDLYNIAAVKQFGRQSNCYICDELNILSSGHLKLSEILTKAIGYYSSTSKTSQVTIVRNTKIIRERLNTVELQLTRAIRDNNDQEKKKLENDRDMLKKEMGINAAGKGAHDLTKANQAKKIIKLLEKGDHTARKLHGLIYFGMFKTNKPVKKTYEHEHDNVSYSSYKKPILYNNIVTANQGYAEPRQSNEQYRYGNKYQPSFQSKQYGNSSFKQSSNKPFNSSSKSYNDDSHAGTKSNNPNKYVPPNLRNKEKTGVVPIQNIQSEQPKTTSVIIDIDPTFKPAIPTNSVWAKPIKHEVLRKPTTEEQQRMDAKKVQPKEETVIDTIDDEDNEDIETDEQIKQFYDSDVDNSIELDGFESVENY